MTETEPGIFTRPGTYTPESEQSRALYRADNVVKMLNADRNHYSLLAKDPRFRYLFEKDFCSAIDIAGGHPKLATLLNVDFVDVADVMALEYEKTRPEFEKLYPNRFFQLQYHEQDVKSMYFGSVHSLAICSHILEHLKPREIRALFGKLQGDALLVYGPNIETARSAHWHHYPPGDHVTFPTLAGMSGMVAAAGFVVKIAEGFSDDYLVYGEREGSDHE